MKLSVVWIWISLTYLFTLFLAFLPSLPFFQTSWSFAARTDISVVTVKFCSLVNHFSAPVTVSLWVTKNFWVIFLLVCVLQNKIPDWSQPLYLSSQVVVSKARPRRWKQEPFSLWICEIIWKRLEIVLQFSSIFDLVRVNVKIINLLSHSPAQDLEINMSGCLV